MDTMIGNLRDIDIKRLRIYMTIVECGGFTLAQHELNLSASTISLRMTELEERLGLQLCLRGRSGFSLTPEGEAVYQACQALLLAHENFITEIGAAKGAIHGELRLGLIDNMIFDPNLPTSVAIARVYEAAVDLEISLYTMPPSELERAVLDHKLHSAIGVFYHRSPGLIYQTLCTEQLLLYCSDAHPLYKMDESDLKLEDIQSAAFIERTYGETSSRIDPIIPMNSKAFASSLEATAILIQTGKYIGFLPPYYARYWSDQNQFKPLLASRITIETELSLVKHRTPRNITMTEAFSNQLFAILAKPLN
jgi:LysR family transcriptional regulator, transcriptional activator for bauABCD operon